VILTTFASKQIYAVQARSETDFVTYWQLVKFYLPEKVIFTVNFVSF